MTPVGIDVAKASLDVFTARGRIVIPREKLAVERLMSELPEDAVIAIEATRRYHRMVVEAAAKMGRDVRLVDPHQFSHYRKSIQPRAKNDRLDAKALMRYADRESDRLKPAKPPRADLQRLKDLLELRETQVRLRTSWHQSLTELPEPPPASKQALAAIGASIAELDHQIREIASAEEAYTVLSEIDGVGPVVAPALVWLLAERPFANSDQVVAFVGLDVAVRQSGKFEGKRKLTKRGPAFIRRLLHCAANSLRRKPEFRDIFRKHHAKGLRTKAVNVVVARKLLRTAFHIVASRQRYDRTKLLGQALT